MKRIESADTVIWLDLPRYVCILRVLKRTLLGIIRSDKGRPDKGEGCDERFDWEFLKYVWNFQRDKNPNIVRRLEKVRECISLIKLTSARDVVEFLCKIKPGKGLTTTVIYDNSPR